jgi:hypothetical protein
VWNQTVNSSATTADSDYVAKTGMQTFNPGETSKTITTDLKADNKSEANETFDVSLWNWTDNVLLISSTGVGTILNDD